MGMVKKCTMCGRKLRSKEIEQIEQRRFPVCWCKDCIKAYRIIRKKSVEEKVTASEISHWN